MWKSFKNWCSGTVFLPKPSGSYEIVLKSKWHKAIYKIKKVYIDIFSPIWWPYTMSAIDKTSLEMTCIRRSRQNIIYIGFVHSLSFHTAKEFNSFPLIYEGRDAGNFEIYVLLWDVLCENIWLNLPNHSLWSCLCSEVDNCKACALSCDNLNKFTDG